MAFKFDWALAISHLIMLHQLIMIRRVIKIFIVLTLLVSGLNVASGQDLSNIGNQKPVTLSGGVQMTGIFYNASGIANRQAPFTYILSGNPVLDIYGVAIPINFIVTQQDQTVQQPFNQFGISPQYKWLTIHLGYRNLTFSPYTLAGYTMLGAGFEINPGKFHAGFMYGRLNKGTKLDTATQSLVPYSFTRKAFAAKIGYGTPDNFLEFSMLKGQDDASSGPKKIDSLTQLVLPEANTVGGVSTRITFFKKLFFEGNFGASILTRDINSPLKADSTNNLVKLAQKIAVVNGTTEYFFAYDAAIGFKGKNYQFKFQYVRVDPDFQSFGAYFFDNDLERYSFAPTFRLFKNKLRFNGNIGFQRDNVDNQKEATSHKVISNATVSADITKRFGIDATYTNFSNNQQPKTIVFADSLKIAETTQNLSITPHYYIIGKTTSNSIIAGANLMKLNDYNAAYTQGAASNNIDSKQFFLNYTYGYLPQKLSAYINLNTIKLNGGGTTDNNTGFTIGVNKSFLKADALKISLSGGLSKDKRNDGSANVTTSSGNVTYTIWKRSTFGLLYYYTDNAPKNITALYPAFMEKRVEASYNYNF